MGYSQTPSMIQDDGSCTSITVSKHKSISELSKKIEVRIEIIYEEEKIDYESDDMKTKEDSLLSNESTSECRRSNRKRRTPRQLEDYVR